VTPESAAVPVVCAIIERGGRFLAAKRAPGQSNALLWEFPGGKVKDGEAAENALEREVQEELGVAVILKKRLRSSAHSYPWVSINLVPFICGIASGEPLAHEHAEIRWVDRKEALRLEWAAADIPVLEEYLTL
jgi:8-oxo-dGTP diphosphatase